MYFSREIEKQGVRFQVVCCRQWTCVSMYTPEQFVTRCAFVKKINTGQYVAKRKLIYFGGDRFNHYLRLFAKAVNISDTKVWNYISERKQNKLMVTQNKVNKVKRCVLTVHSSTSPVTILFESNTKTYEWCTCNM